MISIGWVVEFIFGNTPHFALGNGRIKIMHTLQLW